MLGGVRDVAIFNISQRQTSAIFQLCRFSVFLKEPLFRIFNICLLHWLQNQIAKKGRDRKPESKHESPHSWHCPQLINSTTCRSKFKPSGCNFQQAALFIVSLPYSLITPLANLFHGTLNGFECSTIYLWQVFLHNHTRLGWTFKIQKWDIFQRDSEVSLFKKNSAFSDTSMERVKGYLAVIFFVTRCMKWLV